MQSTEPAAHAPQTILTPSADAAPLVRMGPVVADDPPSRTAPRKPVEEKPMQLALVATGGTIGAQSAPNAAAPAPATITEQTMAPVTTALSQIPESAETRRVTTDPEDAPMRFDIATHRLFEAVPDEIESYFDLFMYVSKANKGPMSQRMFVFQRDVDGKIIPYAEWRVSTGREKLEIRPTRKVRTTTPEGMFMLDPERFYRRYWSRSWDNAPMHYAMFYDMMNNGTQSGLAIHAAVGQNKINRLGRRDSAGCIRLLPAHAKELFYKIQNTMQGQVPILAQNERHSTDRWGRVERDEAGSMMLQDGYRAIVYVENFDGREETVAPVVAYTH